MRANGEAVLEREPVSEQHKAEKLAKCEMKIAGQKLKVIDALHARENREQGKWDFSNPVTTEQAPTSPPKVDQDPEPQSPKKSSSPKRRSRPSSARRASSYRPSPAREQPVRSRAARSLTPPVKQRKRPQNSTPRRSTTPPPS